MKGRDIIVEIHLEFSVNGDIRSMSSELNFSYYPWEQNHIREIEDFNITIYKNYNQVDLGYFGNCVIDQGKDGRIITNYVNIPYKENQFRQDVFHFSIPLPLNESDYLWASNMIS